MAFVILKHGRETSLQRRHPWVFSGAIAKIEGRPESGQTVDILSVDRKFYGRGAYSPHSQIAVRVWTFEPKDISADFFRSRLERAVISRQKSVVSGQCCRLVYAESDGIPGLIVDRYADFLVCQFLSAGTAYWKDVIISILYDMLKPKGIFERSDTDIREKEGLPRYAGVLMGSPPPDLVEIHEAAYRFLVDIKNGHKTGFYLDQRDNRSRIAAYTYKAEVLDCFAYTGGFTIAALKGGASEVVSIDSSADALCLISQNAALNNIDPVRISIVEGDIFTMLRRYRDSRRSFDVIILDPPKFAQSRQNVEQACRGYKDINMLACKLLKPGGYLITFSCSQHISAELFQKTVAYAALDAMRDVQILEQLHQASDHPTALNFPEGTYLKGMICNVW